MADHLSQSELERYRQYWLAPAELLALDDHLLACATCRRQLRQSQPSQSALRTLQSSLQTIVQPATDHLLHEQLAAYQRGRLDEVDRELIESHLEFCPQCTAQMQSLSADAVQSWWQEIRKAARLFIWGAPPAFTLTPRVGWAVAIVALLILGAMLWLRTRTDQQPQVVYHPTPIPTTEPLVAPTAPPVLLALNNGGGQITRDAQGVWRGLEALPFAEQERVKAALTAQQVKTAPVIAELRGKSGDLMSGAPKADSFKLISPVGAVVNTVRPILRWQSLPGATSYSVTIYDASFNELAASGALTATQWAPAVQLARGRVYTWRVIARRDDQEIKAPALEEPEAKFQVLERSLALELTRAKKTYAGNHLVLGLLYAHAGLLADAERELQALVAANPQSIEARNLLSNLHAKRRAS